MGNRIFIPAIKQAYVLSEDATILLFPLSNWGQQSFTQRSFYAAYRDGQFTNGYDRQIIEWTPDETALVNRIGRYDFRGPETITDRFVVSDTEYPESLVKNLDARALSELKIGPVYVEVTSQTHSLSDHRHFAFFAPPYDWSKHEGYVPKTEQRIRKTLPVVDPAQILATRDQNLKEWRDAQYLHQRPELMRESRIPIRFTFPAGMSFCLTGLPKRFNKKYSTQDVELDGKLYTLFTDQLTHFVLDEVVPPAKVAKVKKANK